ncbi:MAG: hypothetical protein JKY67_07970 [Pseudomonadales bacterium]|nr:hypothetical protein [Pseudomonadales bacterium]
MKISHALFNIVAHDALYFLGALSVLFIGLFGLHTLGLGLFVMILYTASLFPVLISTGIHFGKDIGEINNTFKA